MRKRRLSKGKWIAQVEAAGKILILFQAQVFQETDYFKPEAKSSKQVSRDMTRFWMVPRFLVYIKEELMLERKFTLKKF